ncbi:hypothetical protein ACH3XW_45230 [Acanthocheilonema viteae]
MFLNRCWPIRKRMEELPQKKWKEEEKNAMRSDFLVLKILGRPIFKNTTHLYKLRAIATCSVLFRRLL